MTSRIALIFCLFALILVAIKPNVEPNVIGLFPLEHYDQDVSHLIPPNDPDYDKPLLESDAQLQRLVIFQNRYFGASSPWSASYVNHILQEPAPNDLQSVEKSIIADFNNHYQSGHGIQYGENFRPHTESWIHQIASNINLSQFDHLTFRAEQRGITIDNCHARTLPTDDVSFYHYKIAGQGYPFDNLQMSALWAGTPVYIIGETRDHAWMLVITPDLVAWVKSSNIARADESFVQQWSNAAKKNLAAITRTQTSLVDKHQQYLFTAYVGTVLPATETLDGLALSIPVMDRRHHATITTAYVSKDVATMMPLSATPHHFADIIKTLIGRPYGWGGAYFYNDCSAELKSLFTPFGIWLPRHSSHQLTVGKIADISSLNKRERINYLTHNGRRFLSIIYIGGHIILYVGQRPTLAGLTSTPMTYQAMWGLKPHPSTRRAVIGQSLFFPLLADYPEDTRLTSQADMKYFKVAFLDELPNASNLLTVQPLTLRSLMAPSDSDSK